MTQQLRRRTQQAAEFAGALCILMLAACQGEQNHLVGVIAPATTNTTVATIDFNALLPPAPPTDGTVNRGCIYSEDGYRLDNLSCGGAGEFKSINLAPNPSDSTFINRFSGSVSFYNSSQAGVTRLTKVGGGTFQLISIDLDALNPVGSGPGNLSFSQTVTFFGTRPDLSIVTESFITDRAFPSRERFVFLESFNPVIKVEWTQTGPAFHQFDNIVVRAAPLSQN